MLPLKSDGYPLAQLRDELERLGLGGFLVPRADEHLGEYVPTCAERLAMLTGFTGSAGIAVVLPDRAAVFTDGRYTLQLERQTDPALWERRHIVEEPPQAWLAEAAPGAPIGYDPWLFSEEALRRFTAAGLDLVVVTPNPIDTIWRDRPPPPLGPAVPHELAYAGRSAAEKRHELSKQLRAADEVAAVISDPASIAWLLNLRGGDLEYTPTALGFALLYDDGHLSLFMAPEKLTCSVRAALGNEVSLMPPAALPDALQALAGARVRVDPAGAPVWFAQTLRAAGATVVAGTDPCLLPKACKNPVEQQGTRNAHRRDAVAVCRFLHWLAFTGSAGTKTEISAAEHLLALRREIKDFRGESFSAISGAGEHGAIIHYRATPESDRRILANEVYLIDSGAQYLDGTTDVTRTIWTGPSTAPSKLCERYTRVLKGMIAIATLAFPSGVAGPHLDAFARRALWQVGLDYDHGTGHGVGSYLSVHEGPAGLSRTARMVPLAPGMVLSDEPGFYAPGEYGIRLENLLLVQPAEIAGAIKPFLHFETLTLAPFDRQLIATGLLTPDEVQWLDAYHARVLELVAPECDEATARWLATCCLPLNI